MPSSENRLKQQLIVGEWRLDKFLGRGGQGEVWRVRHAAERNAPPRALKACFAQDPKGQARFRREIELLNACKNDLSFLQVNWSDATWTEHAAGAPPFAYHVSELCSGSLTTEKPNLGTLENRLDLFRQACKAVQTLHERSQPVFHRDLKPENFLLALEPRRLVLADFGTVDDGGAAEEKLTGAREVVGTRYYRAPEMLNGVPCAPESEVYSLGKVLEWLITGDISAEISHPRGLPSDPGVTGQLSQALTDLITRATSASRAVRHPTVRALLADLPETVLGIRPRAVEASEPVLLANPERVRGRALELATRNDFVGWREIGALLRKEYHARMAAWQKEYKPAAKAHENASVILQAALPVIVFGLTGLVAQLERTADQRDTLEKLMSVPNWNNSESGYTNVIEAPILPAFFFYHFHGALCLDLRRADLAVDMAETVHRNRHGALEALWKHSTFTREPPILGDGAWDFIETSFSDVQCLREFFAVREDFTAAQCAHSLLISLLAFAYDCARMAPELAPEELQLTVDPWPRFALAQEKMVDAAVRRTVSDPAVVRMIAKRTGADLQRMQQEWPGRVDIYARFRKDAYRRHSTRLTFSLPSLAT